MQVRTYPFENLMFAQLTPHPSFPSLDRVAVRGSFRILVEQSPRSLYVSIFPGVRSVPGLSRIDEQHSVYLSHDSNDTLSLVPEYCPSSVLIDTSIMLPRDKRNLTYLFNASGGLHKKQAGAELSQAQGRLKLFRP